MNNNQETIDGLRKAADWLEERPSMPRIIAQLFDFVYSKEALSKFVQTMGSFEKEWTDDALRLVVNFNEKVKFYVEIDRREICKKIVKWECPDEGLLEMATALPVEETDEISF